MQITLPNITAEQERIFKARYKRHGIDPALDLEQWVLNQIRKEQSDMSAMGISDVAEIEAVASRKDTARKEQARIEAERLKKNSTPAPVK